MTFDPFDDFETRGYLRNVAGQKDLEIVKRLEHNSFLTGIDEAFQNLSRIARLLNQEPQRMTWAMDRLESRHLVRREPHPTDRRVVHTQLTPAGTLLGRQARQARLDGLTQVLGVLEPQSFRCFGDALARLTAECPPPKD